MKIKSLIKRMEEEGLSPYIYHNLGGSVYIKFNNYIGGSLRVADHPQRKRYAYRWNLRKDIKESVIKEKLGSLCLYYPIHAVDVMIKDMVRTLKSNKSKSRPQPFVVGFINDNT